MYHIENQVLILISVGSLGLEEIAVFIEAGDLLFNYVKRKCSVKYPLKLLCLEQIIEYDSEIICGISLLILCIHEILGKIVILYDGGLAILKADNANLLIGSSLAHHLGTYGAVL